MQTWYWVGLAARGTRIASLSLAEQLRAWNELPRENFRSRGI